MRESDIETWAVEHARKQGWWVRKFKNAHRRSAPDDIFAISGVPAFFIEFKATGEEPTPLQAEEHKEMRAAGLMVYVCDSRELFCWQMSQVCYTYGLRIQSYEWDDLLAKQK